MRKDMSKVIVERPRATNGDGYKQGKRTQGYQHDPESAPAKEPLRARNARSKTLNENLRPLIRFLRAQVGRPWDKVKSEMAEHIRLTNAVQKHVLDHVRRYVEENVVYRDGVPGSIGYGAWTPLRGTGQYPAFFVGNGGILQIAKPERERHAKSELMAVRLDALHVAVYLNGCWHEATMKSYVLGLTDVKYGIFNDAVLGQVWSTAKLVQTYGKIKGFVQYAKSVRPMRRAEIKFHALDKVKR